MPRRPSRRFLVADAAVLAAVALSTVVLASISGGNDAVPADATLLSVNTAAPGRTVPAGFLGLSIEYDAIEPYAGTDPGALNRVFLQLVRNLSPGQSPVIRIGGDTTDWTWWPIPSMARPPGVTFSLTPRWIRVTRALAASLNARLILGINLEAGSTELAAGEATALIGGIGRHTIEALELGNEPTLYGGFAWYRTPAGRPVTGRPSSYDFTAFTQDFTQFSSALPPGPLAGPALGAPNWMRQLGGFLAAEPRVGVVTLHRYPLQLCYTPRGSLAYPSIAHLLSKAATVGLASTTAPYAVIAHARRLPLRIDEMNTVSCGADPAVSKTFASALWALGALPEMARAGIDGVNIHTFPGAGYELFSFAPASAKGAAVAPEYYGLMMFAQAAPPGSRLIAVSGPPPAGVTSWATRAGDGTVRTVVINAGKRTRVVAIRDPGAGGTGGLERLTAPSLAAASGVTLGGQSFGSRTRTGVLAGPRHLETVAPIGHDYVVTVPAGSAALLTVPAH
jgi:Glycosyl hydrolase family 79 C-terminal beta domain